MHFDRWELLLSVALPLLRILQHYPRLVHSNYLIHIYLCDCKILENLKTFHQKKRKPSTNQCQKKQNHVENTFTNGNLRHNKIDALKLNFDKRPETYLMNIYIYFYLQFILLAFWGAKWNRGKLYVLTFKCIFIYSFLYSLFRQIVLKLKMKSVLNRKKNESMWRRNNKKQKEDKCIN